MRFKCFFASAIVHGLCVSASLADPPASVRVFATGLNQPVAIASAPGNSQFLYVASQFGQISSVRVSDGAVLPVPFLDLTAVVGVVGDGGLLGLTFDPDYSTNGYFYVFYNAAPNPPNDRVLARYHATPGSAVADSMSGTILWRFPRPIGHNGGWIGFSPINNYLYLSMGDGGTGFTFDAPNNAQTITNNLLGKMLRIDVRSGDGFPADPDRNYQIPPSNPFVGRTGDDEIWAYGLRNPWRCSFDRLTGDLYIADVGQDAWEEVNVEPATSPGGLNYGWKCMEATHCTGLPNSCTCNDPSLTLPALELSHTVAHSITGGYVYRGSAIPALQGHYLFGDFQDSRFWSFRMSGSTALDLVERTDEFRLPSGGSMANISALGEDAAGELYLSDYMNGLIYKIVPRIPCPPDFDNSGVLMVDDIFAFLNAWFTGNPAADFNGTGGVSVQDIFDFLNAWFLGCG